MVKENATCIENSVAVTADQLVENPELERSIGNAREAGMAKDLNLSSSNYSLAVSIFFLGYLLLEVPSNMILSRTRPSLFLPGLMIVWGGMVIAYVGIDTKDHLIALRFCLGLVEAGFFRMQNYVEGCMTIGFAVIAIFILPDFPATTSWLTPEEREYAIRRLAADNNYTLLVGRHASTR
ncbi:hypothetical protein MY10362_008354 [Beauveria mimosiformis]